MTRLEQIKLYKEEIEAELNTLSVQYKSTENFNSQKAFHVYSVIIINAWAEEAWALLHEEMSQKYDVELIIEREKISFVTAEKHLKLSFGYMRHAPTRVSDIVEFQSLLKGIYDDRNNLAHKTLITGGFKAETLIDPCMLLSKVDYLYKYFEELYNSLR